MPEVLNINITLSDEFLRDIMTTMVESGGDALWYWDDGDLEFFQDVKVERDNDLNVRSIEFTLTEPMRNRYVINSHLVAKAIGDLIRGNTLNDFLMEHLRTGVLEGDAGEIDSIIADCIAQQVCFGEQVYS